MKVKRISQGCCGMQKDEIYEAKWVSTDLYVSVLVNGEWSDHHWFPGCFEVVSA